MAVAEGIVSAGLEIDLRAPLADETLTIAPLPAFVVRSNQIEFIVLSSELEA